jgi:hypothetical protein
MDLAKNQTGVASTVRFRQVSQTNIHVGFSPRLARGRTLIANFVSGACGRLAIMDAQTDEVRHG